jgi:aminocarboxymuconate-semialdehyde decarboxylase
MTVVDVHAHYLSPVLLDGFRNEPDRFGVSVRDTDAGSVLFVGDDPTNQAIPHILGQEQQRLEHMDATGVDVQLISSWMQLNGYVLPTEQGIELSRAQNDTLADFVRRHPDRLVGAATVPLQDVQAACEELDRTVGQYGFRGVQIGTHVNDLELGDPIFTDFWQLAEDRDLLVSLHPFDPPGAGRLGGHLMDMLVGFPAETTFAASSLIFSGVFDRHPRLQVVLPHGGGFLPYQVGRLQRGHEVLGTGAVGEHGPRHDLGGLFFDTIVHDTKALAFLIEQVGQSRVLLGSDYPFNLGSDDPLASLEAVRGLDSPARDLMAGATAVELLKMHRRPSARA